MLNDTTPTEAAPLSVEEMRKLLAGWCVSEEEEARAIATAAGLERLTNWILARERDAGKAPIPALETVGEALAEPMAMARTDDGPVLAFAPKDLEAHSFGAEDLDERGMPKVKS